MGFFPGKLLLLLLLLLVVVLFLLILYGSSSMLCNVKEKISPTSRKVDPRKTRAKQGKERKGEKEIAVSLQDHMYRPFCLLPVIF